MDQQLSSKDIAPVQCLEVIGSNPVGDAREVLIISSSHLFTELKIYHLSFLRLSCTLHVHHAVVT